MSVPGRRAERLAHQLRNEIAELMERGLKDPRIGFATVTRVELTPDLRHASVRVSVMGSDEAQHASLAGLSSASGYLRHEIAQRLRLRYAPELTFVLDHGAEDSERIETLLQKLKDER